MWFEKFSSKNALSEKCIYLAVSSVWVVFNKVENALILICHSTFTSWYGHHPFCEFQFHFPNFRFSCPPNFIFTSPCFPVISSNCEIPGDHQQSHWHLHLAVHEMNWLAVKTQFQSPCQIMFFAPTEGSLSPRLFSTVARPWLVITGKLCLAPSHILAPLLLLATDPRWLLRPY